MRETESFRDEPLRWPLISGGAALLLASLVVRALLRPQAVPKQKPFAHRVPTPARVRTHPRAVPPAPKAVVVRESDDQLLLPSAQYEREDVTPRFIAGAFALLVGSLALVTLGVLWLFPLKVTDRVFNRPLPVYPAPRLQVDPQQDMQRFLAAELQQLNSYGWVDKEHGIVHLPIDVAMDQVVQRGIADWPDATHPAANGAAGSAASTAAARSR